MTSNRLRSRGRSACRTDGSSRSSHARQPVNPVCNLLKNGLLAGSSHFTRVTRIFAAELGVAYELQPIYDMNSLDPAIYGGHPAMKLPNMQIDGRTIFGMQNICRALARIAPRRATIIWPETIDDDLLANAQELVLHSMATQVQIVVGTVVAKLLRPMIRTVCIFASSPLPCVPIW